MSGKSPFLCRGQAFHRYRMAKPSIATACRARARSSAAASCVSK
jgi:hypothetical protein